MYEPIGDRVLVTIKIMTGDQILKSGLLLPEGITAGNRPPELLEIIAKGNGPACDNLNVGDFVLIQPESTSFLVFVSKEGKVQYHIVNAALIIGKARKMCKLRPVKI